MWERVKVFFFDQVLLGSGCVLTERELGLNACHLISSHHISHWLVLVGIIPLCESYCCLSPKLDRPASLLATDLDKKPFHVPRSVAVDGSFREVAGKCAARGSGVVQLYQHGGNEP